ncbi:MAG: GYD domain-containing protein [Ktedonobacteraceae bacterium]
MPLYMTKAAYTPDAWAALVKNPQNREDVLRALIEKLGGRLVSFYYAFGEYDVYFIAEMPDETTITAAVLAATSAGHLKSIATTTLLTTQQAMEAMRKAGAQTYQAPS